VLEAAVESDLDEVFLFTDDDDVFDLYEKHFSKDKKIKIVQRSSKSATDTASTEMGIMEFAEQIDYDFDVFCLLQATSPFTHKDNINQCLKKITEGFDSVLTVVRTHRFIWNENGTPVN